MSSFASRLNKAMELKNMKQSELVEKTGITKGAISQYLKGEYEPKQINLYKISKALQVNPVWLMGKEVDMESGENSYYLNNDVRKLAQELFDNRYKGIKPLFSLLKSHFIALFFSQKIKKARTQNVRL